MLSSHDRTTCFSFASKGAHQSAKWLRTVSAGRHRGRISCRDADCDIDDIQLKAKGSLGNGHFMMLENNRKQVFDVINGWLDQKAKA
jgi:hypothetical protein